MCGYSRSIDEPRITHVNHFYLFGHSIGNILQSVIPDSVLHKAVDVDGHDALASGRYAARAQRVAEGVVLQFVSETTAGTQRIHTVRPVQEEAVTLGPHLSREVLPFLINIVTAVVQQIHRFHGKGQQLAGAFRVEPVHEPLLKPVHRFPLHGRSVRKDELGEHAVEVRMIEVRDVPEDALIASGGCGLIERVDHLLEGMRERKENSHFEHVPK